MRVLSLHLSGYLLHGTLRTPGDLHTVPRCISVRCSNSSDAMHDKCDKERPYAPPDDPHLHLVRFHISDIVVSNRLPRRRENRREQLPRLLR